MRKILGLFALSGVLLACSWDHLIWTQRSPDADPLYRFIRDGKAGYIDGTGKVVIEPMFRTFDNYLDEFHEGVLEVYGKFFDKSGQPIPKEQAPAPKPWPPYSEGLKPFERHGQFGYVDESGKVAIQPQFALADSFHDSMARVVTLGPCSYWSHGPCGYVEVLPSSARGREGLPACAFSFVDKTGLVLPVRLDDARDFSEGLAAAMSNDRWGYIDKSGVWIIEPRFTEAHSFSEGRAAVQIKIKDEQFLWGYVDSKGRYVVPPTLHQAGQFQEGYAAVASDRDRYWYIDNTGAATDWGTFAAASPFFKGLAHIRLHPMPGDGPSGFTAGRFAYINTKGEKVFEYISKYPAEEAR